MTTSRISVLFSNDTVRLSCSCCPHWITRIRLPSRTDTGGGVDESYRDFWRQVSALGTCTHGRRSEVYNIFVTTASRRYSPAVSPERSSLDAYYRRFEGGRTNIIRNRETYEWRRWRVCTRVFGPIIIVLVVHAVVNCYYHFFVST